MVCTSSCLVFKSSVGETVGSLLAFTAVEEGDDECILMQDIFDRGMGPYTFPCVYPAYVVCMCDGGVGGGGEGGKCPSIQQNNVSQNTLTESSNQTSR